MKNEIAPRFRTTVYLTSAVLLMLQSAVLAQVPNSWTSTGSLAIGRHSHTATLLLDGKVLVAGGENDFVQSRSELYDPATGVWELTGGLNVARAAHTATLLQDGKVLVVGGRTTTSSCEVVTSSAEIYDPQKRNWTSVSNLSSPSYGHTATLLPDGRVLVAGGWHANSVLKKTEIYDANTGQWSLAAPLNTARTWHSATLLKTGKVLVAGGALHIDFPNTKVSTLSSAEIFDPSTRQWSSTGSLGEGRYRHTETLLPNGQVLVATGQGNEQTFLNSTEQYDPASGRWISSNGFRRPCAETATLLDNGGVLFVGCLGGLGDGFITETQVFHPGSGIWSEAGRLNIGRSLHTSTLLRDGRVLLAGGLNAFRSAELYVPQPAGSLPTQNFFVPSILSSAGASGSIYTSEMTLTNSSAEDATVEFTYTTEAGEKRTVATPLLAGRQRIVSDSVSYLRNLGLTMPESNSAETLHVRFLGSRHSDEAHVMVRTTAPVAKGRTGLAYPGVPSHALLHGTAYLCGLRQNASDRSNVALQNAGAAEDGNITLRLWVYSGNGPLFPQNLPDIVLVPGAFHQINGILASNGLSFTNGYVRIERTAGTAPYYAYAVINDQFNSDGSFVPPILESTLMSESRLTLPAIVEANGFTTEVVATNWSSTKKTLHCRYVADAVQGADSTASFTIDLNPHEQLILPDFVQHLRDSFIAGIGPKGPAFAGKMSAWVADPGGLTGIAVAARTSVPGTTGRHGLFYTAVPDGMTSTRSAWVFGLQQNAETRSNLVLVNTGIPDGIADVFRVELFDGETGRQVSVLETTVETGRWKQLGSVLAQHAPGTTQGYARVTRIQGSPFTVSGGGPFIAYAILNDGGQPGERTGDSAYVASAPARAGSASVTYAWFSCYRSPWDY